MTVSFKPSVSHTMFEISQPSIKIFPLLATSNKQGVHHSVPQNFGSLAIFQ